MPIMRSARACSIDSPNSIPIGSELVIRGYGTRDGSNKAVGREMTFSDGRALFFGGTQTPDEKAGAPQ